MAKTSAAGLLAFCMLSLTPGCQSGGTSDLSDPGRSSDSDVTDVQQSTGGSSGAGGSGTSPRPPTTCFDQFCDSSCADAHHIQPLGSTDCNCEPSGPELECPTGAACQLVYTGHSNSFAPPRAVCFPERPGNAGCGNGVREDPEECDGADTPPDHGCDGACRLRPLELRGSRCGDGIAEEACDDGNTLDGDGCSALCRPEPGWSCSLNSSEKSLCSAIIVEPACDGGTCADR